MNELSIHDAEHVEVEYVRKKVSKLFPCGYNVMRITTTDKHGLKTKITIFSDKMDIGFAAKKASK